MAVLEKNVKLNFLNYDKQIWVVEENTKIEKNLLRLISKYEGVSFINLKTTMYKSSIN